MSNQAILWRKSELKAQSEWGGAPCRIFVASHLDVGVRFGAPQVVLSEAKKGGVTLNARMQKTPNIRVRRFLDLWLTSSRIPSVGMLDNAAVCTQRIHMIRLIQEPEPVPFVSQSS